MEINPDEAREAAVSRLSEEFSGVFSTETIRRYVLESFEQPSAARLAELTPLFALRFTRERLWALAESEERIPRQATEVLFVCARNAGRSQMAAGLLNKLGDGRVHVRTAGSAPAEQISPAVIEAMGEIGVDLAQEFPKPLTDEFVAAADAVVTMGCGDACPIFEGKHYEDWDLDDPEGKDLAQVRGIRDDLELRVVQLLGMLSPTADRA